MTSRPSPQAPEAAARATPAFRVIRRNGSVSDFDAAKIVVAMTKAFLAVEGGGAAASRRVHETVEELAGEVVAALTRRADFERAIHIEDVQDQVELALMRGGHHKVARAYVLYREARAAERRKEAQTAPVAPPAIHVRRADGSLAELDETRLALVIREACAGLDGTDPEAVLTEARRNLYDGVSEGELAQAPVMAARALVETEPNYAFVSARLLLDALRAEALTAVFGAPTRATRARWRRPTAIISRPSCRRASRRS
ncbi:hypothetical protein HNR47_000205 [Methylopila jiangsuensis]|nr:hypothetical protein [Methylopila jiangsuensis]